MTDINLKDFDKKNWDEFVHLRALQDVINQENAVNNEQNQQITQNSNDISTNKDAINKNTSDINTNKQGITENKAAIDTNTGDIATNKQGIADNKTAIDDLETEAILKDESKATIGKNLTNVDVNGKQSMGSYVHIKQLQLISADGTLNQVSDLILSFMSSELLNEDKQIVLTYDLVEHLNEFTGTGTVFVNGTIVYATIHVTPTEIDISFTDTVVTQLETLKVPYQVQAKLTLL